MMIHDLFTFFTTHWVPILVIMILLNIGSRLSGIATGLSMIVMHCVQLNAIASSLNEIEELLTKQDAREEAAANARSKYPSMNAQLDTMADSLDGIWLLLSKQDDREEAAANAKTSNHISRQFLPRD